MSRLIVPKLHNSRYELLSTTFHSLITTRTQFGTTWSELPYCWASSGDYPWCWSRLHIHHPKASDQWHGMGFLMKPPSSAISPGKPCRSSERTRLRAACPWPRPPISLLSVSFSVWLYSVAMYPTSSCWVLLHHLGQARVSDQNFHLITEENVGWLEVSMDDWGRVMWRNSKPAAMPLAIFCRSGQDSSIEPDWTFSVDASSYHALEIHR